MDNIVMDHDVAVSHRLLSLREAIVLADVPEKEKCVRKDIEAGVFKPTNVLTFRDARPRYGWPYVIAFAAVYGNDLLVDSRSLRKTAFNKVILYTSSHRDHANRCEVWGDALQSCILSDCKVDIDKYLEIPLGRVCATVKPRADIYAAGLSRVDERDEVMGGAAVFRGTRLPVHHVAQMIEDGETIENIVEDYPYLTRGDVEFACLYNRARPLVGRPSKNRKAPDDATRNAR